MIAGSPPKDARRRGLDNRRVFGYCSLRTKRARRREQGMRRRSPPFHSGDVVRPSDPERIPSLPGEITGSPPPLRGSFRCPAGPSVSAPDRRDISFHPPTSFPTPPHHKQRADPMTSGSALCFSIAADQLGPVIPSVALPIVRSSPARSTCRTACRTLSLDRRSPRSPSSSRSPIPAPSVRYE